MIALSLDTPEELGAAFYASYLSVEVSVAQPRRSPLWQDLDMAERMVWIAAATRLIELYRAEDMTMGSLNEPSK